MARRQAETGSHAAHEAPSGLRPAGVDPARKFTPGPWHVVLDAFHVGNKRVASFHPSAIAKVYGDEPKDDDPKSTANARLIAKAPDMHDALIRARDMAYGPSRDSCAFCDSVRHKDGTISHDEDCPESYIEGALGL